MLYGGYLDISTGYFYYDADKCQECIKFLQHNLELFKGCLTPEQEEDIKTNIKSLENTIKNIDTINPVAVPDSIKVSSTDNG